MRRFVSSVGFYRSYFSSSLQIYFPRLPPICQLPSDLSERPRRHLQSQSCEKFRNFANLFFCCAKFFQTNSFFLRETDSAATVSAPGFTCQSPVFFCLVESLGAKLWGPQLFSTRGPKTPRFSNRKLVDRDRNTPQFSPIFRSGRVGKNGGVGRATNRLWISGSTIVPKFLRIECEHFFFCLPTRSSPRTMGT